MTRLSKNFTLAELTKSATAIRLGIDNTPDKKALENLQELAVNVLQPIRDEWAMPVIINSGFRAPQLNHEINGALNSQHMTGNAADLEIPGVSNYDLACWIRDHLEFDQLILEFYTPGDPNSGWVHVSYVSDKPNRQEVLTIGKGITKRGLHK